MMNNCKGCEGGVCKDGNCGHGTCGACKYSHHCRPMKLAWALVLIGALNWGVFGITSFAGKPVNVVHWLLASMPKLEWTVYVLVGVAALMKLIGCRCKTCKGLGMGGSMMKDGMDKGMM